MLESVFVFLFVLLMLAFLFGVFVAKRLYF